MLCRYSEAEETFKQLDPERGRSQGTLRRILEHFQGVFLLNHGYGVLTWESFCEKQNFFLDVSEELGDRQLTAQILQLYGTLVGCHSLGKLAKQQRWRPQAYEILEIGIEIDKSFEAQEASSLKLWLKQGKRVATT